MQAPLPPRLLIYPVRVFLALCSCITVLLACYVGTVMLRLGTVTSHLLTSHQSLVGLVRLFDLDAVRTSQLFFPCFNWQSPLPCCM